MPRAASISGKKYDIKVALGRTSGHADMSWWRPGPTVILLKDGIGSVWRVVLQVIWRARDAASAVVAEAFVRRHGGSLGEANHQPKIGVGGVQHSDKRPFDVFVEGCPQLKVKG